MPILDEKFLLKIDKIVYCYLWQNGKIYERELNAIFQKRKVVSKNKWHNTKLNVASAYLGAPEVSRSLIDYFW